MFVPPPALMGIVGGSGVPNLRRLAPVDIVPPGVGAHVAAMPIVVAHVGCTPLPLGSSSVSLSSMYVDHHNLFPPC